MELFGYTLSYIPSFGGAAIAIALIFLLAAYAVNKKNNFAILFGHLYEQMFDFFSDILGEKELAWIKSFVTNMFFVILIYNLLGLMFDLL
jgi:F0F1-type ATP synthase membrane subunit a